MADKDTELKQYNVPLNGKCVTAVDGTELSEGDFQVLQNMRYGQVTPKSISGMTKINTSVMNATYFKPRSGFHFRKSQPSESHALVQAWNTGLTTAQVLQNTTAIPSAGAFSATALWSDTASANVGRFSFAPDGCVAYMNGKDSCIWGGDEYRCAGFILKSGAVAATATLTSDATAPSDGEQVVLDTKTYTFKTVLTPTEGEVLIGGSAAVALDNLKSAVNHTGTPDTDYKCAAAHTTVQATTNTNTTQVFEAITAGTSGNVIASTETSAHLAFGGTVFSGGLDEGTSYFYDYSDRVINTLSDAPNVATLATAQNVYIASTRPLKGVKLYVSTANTTAATVAVSYWASSTWTAVAGLSDGTSVGGKSLAQTGSITFTTTVTSAKPKVINNIYAYWYKFVFTGIDATTTIYYVTLDAPFQQIVDLWDGIPRPILSYFRYTTLYIDETTNVYDEDYDSADSLTFSAIGGLTNVQYILCGFAEKMTGLDIGLVPGGTNSNNVTVTISVWDGDSWASVGVVDDGTREIAKSFSKKGIISWDAPTTEFKNVISNSDPWYYYKISFSGTLSATVNIDYITGIPAQKSIHGYGFSVMWQNSIWLFNENSGKKNSAIASLPETVCVFNGDAAISPDSPMTFGNEEGLTAAATLFTRFSGDLYDNLITFKNKETWLVDGTNPFDFRKFQIADNYGCVAPGTLKSCDVGYEISPGLMKHVLIWQAENAIVLFDGVTVQPISDDIQNYFDKTKSECIPSAMLPKSEAFYDDTNFEYHWLFASGASATTLNKEWVYDVRKKKWYQIDRGSGKYLQIGFQVRDTNGFSYSFGGIDTGYIERLEYGTTFDGTSIISKFRIPDIAFLGWLFLTKIRFIKHVAVSKTTTTNTVTMTHYGDCVSSSSNTATVVVNNSTKRVISDVRSMNWGDYTFHSLECSLTTTNENIGYEPIGIGILYQEKRVDRL